MSSLRRLYGLVLRQVYTIRRSPPRYFSYAFWPTFQMVTWGFVNKYLYASVSSITFNFSTLLGAVLIYGIYERMNINVMMGFLEDTWSRNIGNILITPTRPLELLGSYVVNGLLAVTIGSGVAWILAYFIFGYSVFTLGIYLLAFLLNLMLSGWCIGFLLISLILRYGPSGESFGWMSAYLLSPFLAVYYPVSILPSAMQFISWRLPGTYVFEGLREFITTQHFNVQYFEDGLLLNLLYLTLAAMTFLHQLKKARQRGGLLSMGE